MHIQVCISDRFADGLLTRLEQGFRRSAKIDGKHVVNQSCIASGKYYTNRTRLLRAMSCDHCNWAARPNIFGCSFGYKRYGLFQTFVGVVYIHHLHMFYLSIVDLTLVQGDNRAEQSAD